MARTPVLQVVGGGNGQRRPVPNITWPPEPHFLDAETIARLQGNGEDEVYQGWRLGISCPWCGDPGFAFKDRKSGRPGWIKFKCAADCQAGLIAKAWNIPAERLIGNPVTQEEFVAEQAVFAQQRQLVALSEEEEEPSAVEVNLGDVTPKNVEWVWRDRLARGKLALLVGDPGVSKSTVGLDIGSRISNGREWPDRSGKAPKGNIILLTAEDDLADTVVPRVVALGGAPKAFTVLQAVKVGDRERQFSLVTDLCVLEACIVKHAPVAVFIDTVNSYLGTPGGGVKVDTFKDADVRSVLLPLVKLAEKYRVAVVGIMHLNKNSQVKALYRVLGSIGYTGAARIVLMAAPDPDDASGRWHFLFGEKNSNGPKAPPLAYEREGHGIRWSNQPVENLDSDAILSGSLSKDERGALDSARQFLEEALKDGPVEVDQLKADAEANGIAKKTLRRAKEGLKVRSIRTGGIAGEGTWVWQLPRRPVIP